MYEKTENNIVLIITNGIEYQVIPMLHLNIEIMLQCHKYKEYDINPIIKVFLLVSNLKVRVDFFKDKINVEEKYYY